MTLTQPIKLTVIANNENPSMCTECGGNCCKNYAGGAIPSEFGAPSKPVMMYKIWRALASGLWAVDSWEGDPRPDIDELSETMYLRPAHTNAISKVMDRSWGGTCVFWDNDGGCSLSWDERPAVCRDLVPNYLSTAGCFNNEQYTKGAVALAWIPYQDIIAEAADAVQTAIIEHLDKTPIEKEPTQ